MPIGIGEELDGLGLGGIHDKSGNVFLKRAFLKQSGEAFRASPKLGVLQIRPDDDAGRIEIVI